MGRLALFLASAVLLVGCSGEKAVPESQASVSQSQEAASGWTDAQKEIAAAQMREIKKEREGRR